MTLEITRLHLSAVTPPGTRAQWPVHGFVVTYPGGAALVDTGVGGPQGLREDWRAVNRHGGRGARRAGHEPRGHQPW